MKSRLFVTIGSVAIALLAADTLQPVKAKLGLWEITTSQQIKGIPSAPAMPSIPEDKLAQLPPQQRAQIEAMMKQRASSGGNGTRTRQTCVTQEKLDKAPFSEDRKSCQRTIVTSTASVVEIHEVCTQQDGSKQTVDAHYELNGTDKMKGTVKMKGSAAGHDMEMNLDIQGKWISADCGTVKN